MGSNPTATANNPFRGRVLRLLEKAGRECIYATRFIIALDGIDNRGRELLENWCVATGPEMLHFGQYRLCHRRTSATVDGWLDPKRILKAKWSSCMAGEAWMLFCKA